MTTNPAPLAVQALDLDALERVARAAQAEIVRRYGTSGNPDDAHNIILALIARVRSAERELDLARGAMKGLRGQ